MDHPNLDELTQALKDALKLCEDPEPGLSTWRIALGNALRRVDQFHPDGPRAS